MLPTKSEGVRNQQGLQNLETRMLSPDEQQQYLFITQRATRAKNSRALVKKEFDDLTYEQDYQANKDAVNSYLRAKRNDDEVRVNTGVTEKRVESVVNEILSYNFQHELHAFDKDDLEIEKLGEDIGDIVTRTNEIEKDDDMRVEALLELISQRALFIEEFVEEKETNSYLIKRLKKRIVAGIQMFLGDVTIPAYRFNEQPYIIKYDRMNYWTAKQTYGDWKNWKYVRPGINLSKDWCGGEFNWRFSELNMEEVEIVHYMSAPDNEYQIIINGVPMCPVGEKLPWEHEGYNITMTVPKSMGRHFAYGKPITASLKYIQGLSDETVRNLIRKFRQAINPPMSVAGSGKVYSKDIWEAGKITYGMAPNTFNRLIEHNGVTQSEFEMFNVIKGIADEFASSSNTAMGRPEDVKQSATQIVEMRKQAAKMLGMVLLAWQRTLRELTYLRIFNIMENFLEPQGKELDPLTGKMQNVFAKFTLKDKSFENHQQGTKVLQFTDRNLTIPEEEELLDAYEEGEKRGEPFRMSFINAKKLKEVLVNWYVVVVPKEKEDSSLHKLMFSDKYDQAFKMSQTLQRPLNPDKWIEEYQQTWKVRDAFIRPEQQPMGSQGMAGQPTQEGQQQREVPQEKVQAAVTELEGLKSRLGEQMTAGIKAQTKRPPVQSTELQALQMSGAL